VTAPELLRCETPTDAQLSYVAVLCRERGFPVPAVYSKQHTSLLIGEIRDGRYVPEEWLDYDDSDVPF